MVYNKIRCLFISFLTVYDSSLNVWTFFLIFFIKGIKRYLYLFIVYVKTHHWVQLNIYIVFQCLVKNLLKTLSEPKKNTS